MSLFLLLFFVPCFVFGASRQDINIKSKYLSVMKEENVAEFTEDVFVNGTEYTLNADKMVVYYDSNRVITRTVMSGNIKLHNSKTNVLADDGVFYVKDNLVVLRGNVEVKENGITVDADRFEYNTFTKESVIRAKGKSRVKIMLE
ncbi:MAG: LPS export ABC transporter periplasmic protein LptC [Rickettsiales bacterium]|nr:LPS export ABC transporter periplasmic protein LptC [Rickettsiales bacterium]